jgi:cob(I)alamin adenosyltransferase
MAQAVAQGIKPEQALACIGLGLMQKMAGGSDASWIWNEAEDGGQADLAQLRQRLELIQLALNTGAPLSTAEVTQLLGARPGAAVVQRAGLRARRLGRNVWKLSRASGDDSRTDQLNQLSSNPFARRF